ncbi:DUF2264 domain-containing protein [Cellulophaga fucicola]|uniref:DUF2264 domain-containing protein n=1 Tax=Cellulophaga fucicola TaxID=76595 RepID=UPI003EB6A0EB
MILIKRTLFILVITLPLLCNSQKENNKFKKATGAEDRAYAIKLMQKIVDPVLYAINKESLDKDLPRKPWEATRKADIRLTTIQAFGRSLSGLSPWLSLGEDDTKEGKLRKKYIELSRIGLIHATDPNSNDYMFSEETKTYERIVHNAYFAYPLLIAPEQLWDPLTPEQKANVIAALKTHREFKPFNNNWLLFASLIEATIWKLTGECDNEKLKVGVDKHMEWYIGDGMYGDGAQFHWDYYNSFVIQPLLLEILKVCKEKNSPLKELYPTVLGRAKRYAEIQEHLISPEGTFPIIGRSSVYRIAAFQHLGYIAYRKELPRTLEPGSTRAALIAVTKRLMDAPGTFDSDGWLNIGVVGEQINAADVYSYTGALYMCTMGLTQLGLPGDDPFWTDPAGKWFQQKVWSGADIHSQHEYYGK